MSDKIHLNNNTKEKKLLSSLLLFNGLNDDVIDKLLCCSHAKTYNSGHIISFQNDKVSHLYIVLEGNVKIFRSTETGDESILQILVTGDTFMESAIFTGTLAPFSTEAIEKTRLLLVPTENVVQTAHTNNIFANNLLKIVSKQSNILIQQIEQITLKSSIQRVGRFLVKIMLDTQPRSLKFDLPFEKSLIANHLAMTPETLSRSLRQLQDSGAIKIDGKQVSLSETFALCKYGDPDLAKKCDSYGSKKCPVAFYE